MRIHEQLLNVTNLLYSNLKMLEMQDFSVCTVGNRRDIEHLYQRVTLKVQSKAPQWVQHQCHAAGCSEGMVTIDGNEKLTRAMCASPEKMKCPLNHINLVRYIGGGRHQMASKYCTFHWYLASSAQNSEKPLSLTVRIPLHPQRIRLTTSDAIGSLPDAN